MEIGIILMNVNSDYATKNNPDLNDINELYNFPIIMYFVLKK